MRRRADKVLDVLRLWRGHHWCGRLEQALGTRIHYKDESRRAEICAY